jgi:hypothetical protein
MCLRSEHGIHVDIKNKTEKSQFAKKCSFIFCLLLLFQTSCAESPSAPTHMGISSDTYTGGDVRTFCKPGGITVWSGGDLDGYHYCDTLYFASNSHVLDSTACDVLHNVAEMAKNDEMGLHVYGPDAKKKRVPFPIITISAYADKMGSAPYNKQLSKMRASEAKRYLISQGIPASSIQIKNYGSAATPRTAESNSDQAYRRVVILSICDKIRSFACPK